MTQKKRTINIDGISWCEASVGSNKSILTIHGNKHKINLHLNSHDVGHIANYLWDIMDRAQKQIDYNKKALRGE